MAMPLVASTEWWEAKGRGDKFEDPMAWHAPNTAFGRAVGNLRTWKKGEPDLTKQAGSASDLDELLATASERKVCFYIYLRYIVLSSWSIAFLVVSWCLHCLLYDELVQALHIVAKHC